jgi:hypothetical protein
LRALFCCFDARSRSIDAYLFVACLLFGASVGAAFLPVGLPGRSAMLLGLANAWLLCFLWQILLIAAVRRCIGGALRAEPGTGRSGQHRIDGGTQQAYRGLHYTHIHRPD